MLNTFPTLLAFGLIAPFLLRVSVGLVMIEFGYSKITKQKQDKSSMFESLGMKPGIYYAYAFGLIEIAIGLALVVGIFTQIASLLSAIICTLAILVKRRNGENVKSSFGFLILCLVISLSLIFSGAGFLAFDIPL
jgi:putative oxidoreductase